ncbi:MAG: sulfite exporter TauE/SafE family protein [Patulibacter sp.]|nr:sulfite exporter TauE/SafE family protein [Patulibacter sp.]
MAAPSTTRRPGSRGWTLLAIGTAAGIYSGLFGVGGGTIIVPLLVLLVGFDTREATATSLAAITVIATAGAITHTIYGNVRYDAAAMVAVPAVVGAFAGTTLQQRVPKDWLTLGLAVLLVFGAVDLLRGG